MKLVQNTARPSKTDALRLAKTILDPHAFARDFQGRRSATGTFPLRLYVVLPEGAYRVSSGPSLKRVSFRDLRSRLAAGAFEQQAVLSEPLIVVISAEIPRLAPRYGEKAEHTAFLEAGRAAHRLETEAGIMGFGVSVSHVASPEEIRECLTISPSETALCLVCIGSERGKPRLVERDRE